MAIPYIPKDEEDLQNREGSSLGVESGIISAAPNIAGQQTGSGQYTNLQKYLDSNRGFGSDLAGKVQGAVSDAERSQTELQSQYKSAADKGSTSLDQENIDFVTANPYLAQQGYSRQKNKTATQNTSPTATQTTQQTTTQQPNAYVPPITVGPVKPIDPNLTFSLSPKKSQILQSEQQPIATAQSGLQSTSTNTTPQTNDFAYAGNTYEADTFKKQRDAFYGGPTEKTEQSYFNPVRQKVAYGQQVGSMSESEPGIKSLLGNFYGADKNKYNYTPGQQNLDLLLVSRDPSSKESFLDAQQRARKLQTSFQNLQNELVNYRKQKEEETNKTRNAARSAIGIDDYGSFLGTGPIQQILDATKSQRDAAEKAYQKEIPQVSQALRNKDISGLSDEQKAKLNLQDVYSLYKVDPEKFLKLQDINNLSQSSVATDDQLKSIAALADLAGLKQNWLDPSQAGKFDSSMPFSYDKQGLLDEVEKNRQNYITARQQLAAPIKYSRFGYGLPSDPMKYADIDDIVGMLQNNSSAFTNSDYAPQNLQQKPSGTFKGPAHYYDNDRGVYDARSPYDELDYYKSLLFGPTGIDDTYGRTDVLKAGRQNEIGEIPDAIKKDIMEGWRTTKPFMYDSRNADLSQFDKVQSAMPSGFTNSSSAPGVSMPSSTAGTYDYNNYFASPDDKTKYYASKYPGEYKTMPWDEYFKLYSQGKFY